jgi:hypothetical protein
MRLPLRSWTTTLQSMGFRKRKHANERPAKRFGFETLEERRVMTGLSPVLTANPIAAEAFWSQQVASGVPLLSGPVTDFAPPGARPTNDAALKNLAQTAAPSLPARPVGITGADLLAAALGKVDMTSAATFSLVGGEKQASWSQPPGPQSVETASSTLDLRQLP